MLNLYYSYNLEIDNAYIITVKGNEKSETLSQRCQQSCDKVGMPYKVWDAYDGTGEKMIEPEHLKDDSYMRMLKITDHYMTRGEVACALSHISLWLHCVKIDKPIVILEHDAVMVQKIQHQLSHNTIVYLGGAEWVKSNWPITHIPPHATEGPNYHFICRAHAYSVDPPMAKNLLAHVLKMGICAPLDIMMRTDLFNVTHQGVYAYDENDDAKQSTTILARPEHGRTTKRNDDLSY
jgi:GR25 family glycosyltransferase involved in LPS biosynthesis